MSIRPWQKITLVSMLIITLLAPQLAPFAEGFNFPEKYDMTAILVEQSLYADEADYTGLADRYGGALSDLRSTTIKARVDRYAQDVQEALPGTRALVIQADRLEKTENIAAALERLYFDGDPRETGRTARLKGVVIIGDVPLPVVNKQGSRFISLFPYTDFEQKAYLWNPQTGDFEINADAQSPQPELWHGVIRPPVQQTNTENVAQYRELMAKYLDKNHLYHRGNTAFTSFNKRIFFQDFIAERRNINADAYRSYLKFLDHWGDIAYLRYTRDLFKDLSGPIDEEMEQIQEQARQLADEAEAAGVPIDRSTFTPQIDDPETASAAAAGAGSATGGAYKDAIPDIMTKISKMSDNLMMRFHGLFSRYTADVNDLMRSTGRYTTQTPSRFTVDVDTAVNLIAAKDDFSIAYLKAVNTMIEGEIDRIAALLQKLVPLVSQVSIRLTGMIHKPEPAHGYPSAYPVPVSELTSVGTSAVFTNFSPPFDITDCLRIPVVDMCIPGSPDDARTLLHLRNHSVLGTPFSQVRSVAQCSLFRGSKGSGRYSKLVEANRAFNPRSAVEGDDQLNDFDVPAQKNRCENQIDTNDVANKEDLNIKNCPGYLLHAGCFYITPNSTPPYNVDDPNQSICFPEHAVEPLFDIAGTKERERAPVGFDDYRSCFNFHEKEQWEDHIADANKYLRDIDNENETFEWRLTHSRGVDNYPNLNVLTKDPNQIRLFNKESPDWDRYTLTLADVLNAMGISGGADFQNSLNLLLVYDNGTTVDISAAHPKIQSVTIAVAREPADASNRISSVFAHKEPTNETIRLQLQGMSAQDMPVDQPRYVTFQTYNSANPVGRVTYPDIFSEAGFTAYRARLAQIQDQLNALPRPSSGLPAGPVCDNCLLNLIDFRPEISRAERGDVILSRTNETKVRDALDWKNMGIDEKHYYVNRYYLDSSRQAYVAEPVSGGNTGYELAYFNGEGLADGYGVAINPDLPEETDPTVDDLINGIPTSDLPPETGGEDDPNNPFDTPPPDNAGSEGYELFQFGAPISPWWERMKEWIGELVAVAEQFNFGESEEDFTRQREEEMRAELEALRIQMRRIEGDPENADQNDLSRIRAIALETDSNTLVAGRRAEVKIKLLDQDGHLVNDEFERLDLTLEQADFGASSAADGADLERTGTSSLAARFSSDTVDSDPSSAGFQISMTSGEQTIGLIAPGAPTQITFRAQIQGTNKTAQTVFNVVREARLVMQSSSVSLRADGSGVANVEIFAKNVDNQTITSFNGNVRLEIGDPLTGRVPVSVRLTSGRGAFAFTAGRKAGLAMINATASSIDPGQYSIRLLPGPPVRIGLSSDSDQLTASGAVQLQTAIFDENNNLVDTNSAAQISFRITTATSQFGRLSVARQTVANGAAAVNLTSPPDGKTGQVTVVAQSPGLRSAMITIKSVKIFGRAALADLEPDALAVSLLGIPGGNVAEENYLGGLFVTKGRVQAVNSLTAQPKQYKALIGVNENGGLKIYETGRASARFAPDNNFTMVLSDNVLRTDLAKVTVYTIKDGQFAVTAAVDPDRLADGIYMRKLTADPAYSVDLRRGALRLSKDESEKVDVQTNGYTRILDNDFSLRPVEGKFLTIQILEGDQAVAEILFVQRFNQDVRIANLYTEAPGVYVQVLRNPPQIIHERTWSGNSSAQARGVAFFDKREIMQGASAPGFEFRSLEDSLENFGVGFTDDNKFGLLFAAGETFGEANRHYASDAGIVLGDPTVKISNAPASGNFSSDAGKMIYSSPGTEVTRLISMDYDSNGFEDIFIAQSDGKIRLLQNNGGYDVLQDQGYILDIKNGIVDIAKADFNNDGQMDLVIAGGESCRRGDTCVDIYENNLGSFVRRNLHFDVPDRILSMYAYDLNLDRYPELILADANGDVRVLYNRAGRFAEQTWIAGNVGLRVKRNENLISNILISYDGLRPKNPDDPVSMQRYRTLSIRDPNPIAGDNYAGFLPSGAGAPAARIAQPQSYIEKDFIWADSDVFDDIGSIFSTSTKFARDLNDENLLRDGDRVRYIITLNNGSRAAKRNVMVSDMIPDQVELDRESIRCTDCANGEMQMEDLTQDPLRPLLFKDITVPAGSSRHIVYEVTFRANAQTLPRINIAFSNRFEDTNPSVTDLLRDPWPDMSVTKEGNPTGQVLYLYTMGLNRDSELIWGQQLSSPPAPMTREQIREATGLNLLNPEDYRRVDDICLTSGGSEIPYFRWLGIEALCEAQGGRLRPEGPPPAVDDFVDDLTENDTDGDGLPDSADDFNLGQSLESAADNVQDVVSRFTCSAGCIPLPVNVAFLSPGAFSVLGTPLGFDPGMPIFGWGAPSIIPTWPPMPHPSTLGGRFYVSPALTGGVGFAVCLGPYGTPACFSFGINPLDFISPGVCDAINGAMNSALSAVNSVVSRANEGFTLSLRETAFGDQRARAPFGSFSLGDYNSPVSRNRNIRTPGFIPIISEWFARQTEEVLKAMTLPTFYLIYPDVASIFGGDYKRLLKLFVPGQTFKRTGNFITNLLSYINSIPLINIETQPVTIKIPIITRREIEQVKADALQWVKDEQAEIQKITALLQCAAIMSNEETGRRAFMDRERCQFLTVNMAGLINSVMSNVRALDEWILFPKQILQYREVVAFYMRQIIDYMDTIIMFTGGWIRKNIARVKQWRRAIRDIKEIFKTWKVLFQLVIDYNATCDRCKTERWSLKDLILKIFIALPTPPVIPLPRLPDFVIDVSKIQAGLTIQFPDVQFKSEPFVLPKLPRIKFSPNFSVSMSLPRIPVIPPPPNLPSLPALPALSLPRLPNFPPAPTIPQFSGAIRIATDILRHIFRILCLIRIGLLPTPELMLKTRIEEITARGLTPLLPIDLLLQIESPTISFTYVDKIVVTARTNLQLNLGFIQHAVENIARQINEFTTGLTRGISNLMDEYMRRAESMTDLNRVMENLMQEHGINTNIRINYKDNKGNTEQLKDALAAALGPQAGRLEELNLMLNQTFKTFEKEKARQEAFAVGIPKEIKLEMESVPFEPSKSPRAIADIPEEFVATDFEKRVKDYRDRLAAYVKDTENMLTNPNIAKDLNSFGRYIASLKSPFMASDFKKYLAATQETGIFADVSPPPANEKVSAGQTDFEDIDWLGEDVDADRAHGRAADRDFGAEAALESDFASPQGKLLAYDLPQPPEIPVPSGSGANPDELPQIQNVGLFYVDENGSSSRLVAYTGEADRTSNLADVDVDNDGDMDKIYSYGTNVFLKKNYRSDRAGSSASQRPVFRERYIEFWTIYELLPAAMNINGAQVQGETSRQSSFTFNKSLMPDLAGYELILKNSPLYYETAANRRTIRAHFLPEDPLAEEQAAPPAAPAGGSADAAVQPAAGQEEDELTALVESPQGEILVNNAAPQTIVRAGDNISTGAGAQLTLRGGDGTVFRIFENTYMQVPEGGEFRVAGGRVEVELPRAASRFAPGGTTISAGEGASARIRFFDNSDVTVTESAPFTLPDWQPVFASIDSMAGTVEHTGARRDIVQPRDNAVRVSGGEVLHPLQIARLKWNAGGPGERTITLSKDIMVSVPETFTSGMDIQVLDGVLEILRAGDEPVSQPAQTGMALEFEDRLEVRAGGAVVQYARGGRTALAADETYILDDLEDINTPAPTMELDPAFYFAKIYAFDSEGRRSTASEKLLLAPQVCGDDNPPMATAGNANIRIAVGRTMNLDASRSTDNEGDVISYWLDTDADTDANGDGTANNDRDLWRDMDPNADSDGDGAPANDADSPVFTIGPYGEVGVHRMRLTVRDEGLNEGYQDITVEVITPQIALEPPPLRSDIIAGYVEPAEENVRVSIARLRPGTSSAGWELLRTPSADAGGQYYTDANGRFRLDDLDMRDRLAVRNHEGMIVAEINPRTGRVTITDDRYETRLLPSEPLSLPMRIAVFAKSDSNNNNPLTFVYFVPDVNTDAVIDGTDVSYNSQSLLTMSGVHVKPLLAAEGLGFSFRVLPADDAQIPGAAVVERSGERAAVIDVNGDLIQRDSGLLTLVKPPVAAQNGTSSDEDEPVVFEMNYNRQPIADIFIASRLGPSNRVQIVDEARMPGRPQPAPRQAMPFTDVAPGDSFARVLEDLYRKGIVTGNYSQSGELVFRPSDPITRAEFAQIVLKMLCIIPRPEAYQKPSPFYDVLNERVWFYPVLKEGGIRGFLRGYEGEAQRDEATGAIRTPYRPSNNITWAEAITVVLRALAEENVVDFGGMDFIADYGAPWHQKYMRAAQDLTPYLRDKNGAQSAFLVTPQEFANADRPITRRDFALITSRVLMMRDCRSPWRLDSNGDEDNDGLKNSEEQRYGTNPFGADTDGGGMSDFDEIQRGSDAANNPYDDRPQALRGAIREQEGIYVMRPLCGEVCPCRASVGSGGDLQRGDIIFAAITGPGGLPIYAKSNEETY